MEMKIGYTGEDSLRRSTDRLAGEVFGGLSFEKWYAAGLWGENCIPYGLFDGGTTAAAVFATPMTLRLPEGDCAALQLGTVMTHPAYRGRGLMRRLLERVLADWTPRTETIFLYANDSVLDFYPRFGFRKSGEARQVLPISPRGGLEKLDCSRDWALIRRLEEGGLSSGDMRPAGNAGLPLFHTMTFRREQLWYSRRQDALVVAEPGEAAWEIAGVFGGRSLEALLEELPAGVYRAALGFSTGGEGQPYTEEDTTLFSRGRDIFSGGGRKLSPLYRT